MDKVEVYLDEVDGHSTYGIRVQLTSNIDNQQCRQEESHCDLRDFFRRASTDKLELRSYHTDCNGEQHSNGRLQSAQEGDKQFLGSLTHVV